MTVVQRRRPVSAWQPHTSSTWFWRICAAAVFVLSLPGTVAAGSADEQPATTNVLILSGESPDLPGGRILTRSIESRIAETVSGPVAFYLERVDTGRFPSLEFENTLADLLAVKFKDIRLSLIVAFSEPAVRFVLRQRDAHLAGVPVLLGLVPEGRDIGPLPKDAAIVRVRTSAAATARLALAMYPAARRLIVIGGTSPFDRGWQQSFQRDLAASPPPVPFAFDVDSTLDSLRAKVAALPRDSAVIYMSMTRDESGTTLRPLDALQKISKASAVPVFGASSTYIGQGAVGGYVIDFERHGADLADAAVQMLRGQVPAPKTTPSAVMIDWRQVQQYRLSTAAIPPGSIIAFREPTLWQRQKTTILVAGLIVAIETALIVALYRISRRRHEAQRMFEQSDRLKGSILNSLRSPVAVLDRDGVILSVNDAWRDYAGAAREPAAIGGDAGVNYRQLLSDRILSASIDAAALPLVRKACRGEHPGTDIEYRCEQSGEERWFLMAAVPLRHPEGGAVVTHTDITTRKRDEIRLRESEDRFRRLADGLPMAVWMSDADGSCHYLNRQWVELTGQALGDDRAYGWLDSVHADDREAASNAYLTAFKNQQEYRAEMRLRRHDGGYRWMLNVAMPRYGPDGAFHGYVGGCLDITERRDAERMLRGLNRRLIAAQEDERRRIARELHDHVSQQLALLAIDLQQLSIDPPRSVSRLTSALHDDWRRTTEIASDIHALSHRLHPSKLESLGLIKTLRGHCRDISRQSLAVRVSDENVPESLPPQTALCLFRVAEEALTNVVRHSGAGEAHVSVAAHGNEITLRVADAGRGFDGARGDGIGLVSMRERVEALGGRLSITSVPGRGTVVEASVPLPAGQTLTAEVPFSVRSA